MKGIWRVVEGVRSGLSHLAINSPLEGGMIGIDRLLGNAQNSANIYEIENIFSNYLLRVET